MATGIPGVPGTGLPATHRIVPNSKRALDMGRNETNAANHSRTVLETQDLGPEAKYLIYVYNICELDHVVQQPPYFPSFKIEGCERGKRFSVTTLPAFVKERFEKPGETEYYFKNVDGRKYATSLLNPDTHPSTPWEGQLNQGQTGNNDMTGMNLNKFGVFWSLTKPEDPKLDEEIKQFRKVLDKTMDELVMAGNRYNAEGQLSKIGPLNHFAMEYFGLEAPWHMSHRYKTPCVNCGESILEGLAYHRNANGDICIIDRDRYEASVVTKAEPVKEEKATRRQKSAG